MIKLLGIGLIGFVLLWVQRSLYEKLWQKSLYVSVSFGKDPLFVTEQGIRGIY